MFIVKFTIFYPKYIGNLLFNKTKRIGIQIRFQIIFFKIEFV